MKKKPKVKDQAIKISSPVCFIDSSELREEYKAFPRPEKQEPNQTKTKGKKDK
ncbi:MAG: hypothetical protein RIE86_13140 [Imperialibacter sp.]|uniref:hypothetical protein n=1 Tax=Imperialibacter sp. TaxID=2038411 RepID=UPI0032EEF30A